jgi:hypothetical protein
MIGKTYIHLPHYPTCKTKPQKAADTARRQPENRTLASLGLTQNS